MGCGGPRVIFPLRREDSAPREPSRVNPPDTSGGLTCSPWHGNRPATPQMQHRGILIAVVVWLGALGTVSGQLQHPTRLRNHPAIGYATVPTRDPITELNRKLKAGEVALRAEGESGYLRSVLEALSVPVESQLLVFSKTSFQALRI